MSVSFYLIQDGKIVAPVSYDPAGDADKPFDLNVTNTNAIMLLEMLGIRVKGDNGLTGEIEDVARLEYNCQQVLHALRADPALDAGRLSIEHRSPGCMTMIECGRRDGYLLDRVSRLRQLAEEALLRDAKLVYA